MAELKKDITECGNQSGDERGNRDEYLRIIVGVVWFIDGWRKRLAGLGHDFATTIRGGVAFITR
ncbi:hypothetical protein IIY67_02305, partial [Candidatus Saccharibacteria bacterium]|nr:hypothetical protein [Candidatus Saccharibacteria bacterium]